MYSLYHALHCIGLYTEGPPSVHIRCKQPVVLSKVTDGAVDLRTCKNFLQVEPDTRDSIGLSRCSGKESFIKHFLVGVTQYASHLHMTVTLFGFISMQCPLTVLELLDGA